MGVITSLMNSFFERLDANQRSVDVTALTSIREAMLEILPAANRWDVDYLRQRISSTTDAQQLWFMRAEMNQLMSPVYGERQSQVLLSQLTPMFEGLIDQAYLKSHKENLKKRMPS